MMRDDVTKFTVIIAQALEDFQTFWRNRYFPARNPFRTQSPFLIGGPNEGRLGFLDAFRFDSGRG